MAQKTSGATLKDFLKTIFCLFVTIEIYSAKLKIGHDLELLNILFVLK